VDGILGHILIEAEEGGISMSGTDIEREVRTYVRAEVALPGRRAVHAGLLTSFLRCVQDDTVNISFADGIFEAKCGRIRSHIPTDHPDAYCSLGVSATGQSFRFARNEFQDALSQVAFCCADSDRYPFLLGVNVRSEGGAWIFVAADGNRLAEFKLETEGALENPFSYPRKSVAIAASLFPEEASGVDLFLSRGTATISNDTVSFVTRLCEGVLPLHYVKALERGPHFIKVNREALLKSVGFATEVHENIRLSHHDGFLSIHSRENLNNSQSDIDVECEGSIPFDVTLVGKHLQSILLELVGDYVMLHFTNSDTPIILLDNREDFTAVAWPIRGTN
jgi:DNA polymerase-3 subunit beta